MSDLPSSIDPAEAARFERLARLWWNPEGPFWPLHRLNSLRLGYVAGHLAACFGRDMGSERPLAGLKVLDIGCGGGVLSEAVARLGAGVHGVDVVGKNLRIAEAHAQGSGLPVHYELGSAEALAARGAQYDAVLNMEVVEHVADVAGFMAACAQLVRPGGIMVVATINRTPASFLGAILGAEYVLRWLPKGTHQWRKFVKPAEVAELLGRNGLRQVDLTGVGLRVGVNPLGWRFRLTGYTGINYMLVAVKD